MLKAAGKALKSQKKKHPGTETREVRDSSQSSPRSLSPSHRAVTSKSATMATAAKPAAKAIPTLRKIDIGAKTAPAKPAMAKNASGKPAMAKNASAKPSTSAKHSTSVKPSSRLSKSSRSKRILKSNELTSAKPSPSSTTTICSAKPSTSSKLSTSALADGYDEWQRQKSLNAQYFHFSIMKTNKEKSTPPKTSTTPPKCTTQSAIPQTSAATSPTNTTPPPNYINPITNTPITNYPSQPNEATPPATVPPTFTTTTSFVLPAVEATPLQLNHLKPAILQAVQHLLKPTTNKKPLIKRTDNVNGGNIQVTYAKHKGIPRCVPIAPKLISGSYQRSSANKSAQKPEKIQTGNTKQFPNITLVPLGKLTDKNPSSSLAKPVAQPENSSSLPSVPLQQQIQVTGNQSSQGKVLQSPPAEKNVSILEQYSRTLAQEGSANARPLNALTLRPLGPQGPQTTIIMAVSLPTKHLLRKASVLTTHETIDLTEPDSIEPNSNLTTETDPTEEPNSKKEVENRRNTIRVYPGPMKKRRAGPKGPQIMSLSSKIHDGDVIEIDDSSADSNQSSNSVEHDKKPSKSDEGSASKCNCMANIHTMTDDVPKNLAKPERRRFQICLYNQNYVKLSPAQLPCGSSLLCVDAARFPVILSHRNVGHMLITHGSLPCRLPTYWTLTASRHSARIVLPHSQLHPTPAGDEPAPGGGETAPGGRETAPGGVETAPGGGETAPGGGETAPGGGETASGGEETAPGGGETASGGEETAPGGGETAPGGSVEHKKRPLCTQNHNFKIMSTLSSVQDIRSLLSRGAQLFLLDLHSGRWGPLRVECRALRYHVDADDQPAPVLEELAAMLNRPIRRSSVH